MLHTCPLSSLNSNSINLPMIKMTHEDALADEDASHPPTIASLSGLVETPCSGHLSMKDIWISYIQCTNIEDGHDVRGR